MMKMTSMKKSNFLSTILLLLLGIIIYPTLSWIQLPPKSFTKQFVSCFGSLPIQSLTRVYLNVESNIQNQDDNDNNDNDDNSGNSSSGSHTYRWPRFGLKLDATNLSKEEFQRHYDGKFPVTLTNVMTFDFNPHHNSNDNNIKNPVHDKEKIINDLMGKLGRKKIIYDARNNLHGGRVDTYECFFHEFLSTLSENSDHDDSMYFMNEDILNDVTDFNDAIKLPSSLFGFDSFQYFPSIIRPRNALVIGGVGARSFLHVDPYRWTGWNYLFEGRKLWTFFPPAISPAMLHARNNVPDAWDTFNFTTGYVSEIDLYKQTIVQTTDSFQRNLSSHHLMNNLLHDAKIDQMMNPGFWKEESISHERHRDVPSFLSDALYDDKENDGIISTLRNEIQAKAMQIVQEEGEMILIPPGWWHQVYHLQPSIAIASQYCNEVIKNDVFNHILSWCEGDTSSTNSSNRINNPNEIVMTMNEVIDKIRRMEPFDQVKEVLTRSLISRYGKGQGKRLLSRLYRNHDVADNCSSSNMDTPSNRSSFKKKLSQKRQR